jgi:hypothetical protein
VAATFPPETTPILEAAELLLGAASTALETMHPDALVLLGLLAPLTPAERTTLLAVLEREVAARTASLAAGDGAVGPLDHTSRLFVRTFAPSATIPRPTAAAVYRSSLEGLLHVASFPHEMRLAILGGMSDALPALSPTERADEGLEHRGEGGALEPTTAASVG